MKDFLVALIIHELDGLIVGKVTPIALGIPFPNLHIREYCRVLKCLKYTYSKNMVISMDKKILGIPIISGSYKMQQYFELLLRDSRLITSTKIEQSLKKRVSIYIMNNSYLRILSVDDVASNFNLSPRTLQRKLKEEGSSFKEIIEGVRKEIALHYLRDKDIQIKDIAYSMGYNESSAFIRAFKRWTGEPPIHLSALID